MKRLLALLLTVTTLVSILSGCAKQPAEAPQDTTAACLITEQTVPATEPSEPEQEEYPIPETEPVFTGLSDAELLTYIEDNVYASLEAEFDSDDYVIDDIAVVYVSEEYKSELEFNSQENIYFGYTLSELDAMFDGDRYVFTVGEDGTTAVKRTEILEDNTEETILKNVMIGTGVILVCVTVSCVAASVGGPASMVAVVAASAAKGSIIGAASGSIPAAAVAGFKTIYQTGDMEEALKAAALEGSKGVKIGAITGAIAGGVGKGIQLKHEGNRLPTPRDAELRAKVKYPDAEEQVSFINGKKVPYGTKGSTRPDLTMPNGKGGIEAVEIKRYDLTNKDNVKNLCDTLKRQVEDRINNLPPNSTQRIMLDTKNRHFSKETINNAINDIHKALDDIYPNIPINTFS